MKKARVRPASPHAGAEGKQLLQDVARQNLRRAGDRTEKQFGNVMLMVVAYHVGNAFDAGQRSGFRLSVTAGYDDAGCRILPKRPADELARLKVGKCGDGAGVDDIDVGKGVKRRYGKTGGFQAFRQRRGIALIDFAPQCGEADFEHIHFLDPSGQRFSRGQPVSCQDKQMDFMSKMS